MTLTDFLLARIAEDEALARACEDEVGSHRAGGDFDDGSGPAGLDAFPSYPWGSGERELDFMAGPGQPARVLAECEAKRRIVEECETLESQSLDGAWWLTAQDAILGHLAAAYADHPDYDPGWAAERR